MTQPLLAIALAVALTAPAAMAQKAPPYTRPVEYVARTIQGDSIHIGNGETLTLVTVFATWCTTCKSEFADLENLSRGHTVRVVAVSVDEASTRHVQRFVDARKTTFPVIHDSAGRVTRVFGTVGVPESYLVDADGRIIWHRRGELGSVLGALRAKIAAPAK